MSFQQLQNPISDREPAASALRDSEVRLRLAIKAAGIGVWDWNVETGEVSCADGTELLFGLSPGSFVGYESFFNSIYPEDRDCVGRAINSALKKKEKYEIDYRITWPDGSIHWIESKGQVLRDETDKPVLMVGTLIDISDRKRVEEELRRSQAMLEIVVDNIPQFIGWKNRDSVYLGCNRSLAQVLGLDPTEIVGKTDYDTSVRKEEADFFRECDRRVMETDTPEYHIIEPQLQANGKQAWLDTNKIPLHDASGNVVGIFVTIEDITEREQAEADQALRLSEARFRELLAREELLNRLASQIRASLDLDTILETAVQEIYSLLQLDRCLFIWYRFDTEQPYAEVVREARSFELPSIIGFCIPVAQLGVLGERALNKQIVRVDDITTVTDAVEHQFFHSIGYRAVLTLPVHTQLDEIGVISCSYSSQPRQWKDNEVELLQAVADQIAIAIDQAELYKQSRIAAATAREQAAKLELALHELQQTQAQLVQTEKMSSLGQLVAGVAHEINNPVNFIHANLSHADAFTQDLLHIVHLYQQYYPHPTPQLQAEMETIDLEFLVQDLPKLLASMKVGTDRIRQIVLSLRNFSRLDEAQKKPVDIHEGLDSTLLILQHRLKAKAGRSEVQIIKNYDHLPLVECYAGQLNQVFMNILSNAIDALEEKVRWEDMEREGEDSTNIPSSPHPFNPSAQIVIHTELSDCDWISIRIVDNGPGMTEAVRRRLFDPFFTTKPVGKGTGLGLAISYQIVEKHGGQIQCVSTPGQGTEFAITIPIRQQL